MRQFAAWYGENESPIFGKTRILEGYPRYRQTDRGHFFSDRPRPTQEILIPRGYASGGAAPSLQFLALDTNM